MSRNASIIAETVRKTLRAMHINEADSGQNENSSGYSSNPPTNVQRLRMYVLKEILDTERDYLKVLQLMVEVMAPSLQKLGEDPNRALSCGKDTTSQILSNVQEIHELHVRFLKDLEDALSPSPYHSHCVGKVFLNYKDEFRRYDAYCSNFSRAQKISFELENDPDFKNLIDEWKNSVESSKRKFLHLEGFIITPVQRICKYPLLLRELGKYTPAGHNDHNDVKIAQTVMEQVTTAVNESERRQLMVQAIKDMENLCDTWEQSGFVSKQGFMTKRGGSVKTWHIRWFLLRGYELAYYNEPTEMHPLGILDLTSYKSLEEDASHVGRPRAFGIKMPDRTYYMYTSTEAEKRDWLRILHWKFDCIERTRRQTHHPFETVVFSSLSSILHPKSRRSEEDENDEEVPELDCGKINSGKILPPISLDCDDTFESTESSSSPTTPVHNGQTNKSRLSSTSSNSHSVPTAAVTRSISMKKKKKGLFSKALSPRRNTSTS